MFLFVLFIFPFLFFLALLVSLFITIIRFLFSLPFYVIPITHFVGITIHGILIIPLPCYFFYTICIISSHHIFHISLSLLIPLRNVSVCLPPIYNGTIRRTITHHFSLILHQHINIFEFTSNLFIFLPCSISVSQYSLSTCLPSATVTRGSNVVYL